MQVMATTTTPTIEKRTPTVLQAVVSDELAQEARQRAAREDRSTSSLLRRALNLYLLDPHPERRDA